MRNLEDLPTYPYTELNEANAQDCPSFRSLIGFVLSSGSLADGLIVGSTISGLYIN